MELKQYIREVPDFPKPGVNFKDITTLLQDARAFSKAMDTFTDRYSVRKVDYVVGVESRGFLFAPVLAYSLNCGLVLVRKKGKLPAETLSHSYQLEYGEDTLEIHKDAIPYGARIVLVDDLLATGGTAHAATELLNKAGARIIELAFLIELSFLKGREKLSEYEIFSQINYH